MKVQGGRMVPVGSDAQRRVGQKLQRLGPEMAQLEREAKAMGDARVSALIKAAADNLFKAWQAMNAPGVRGEFR
jgi:hypothetical protein